MKLLRAYDQRIISELLEDFAICLEDRGGYALESGKARSWAEFVRKGKG